MLSSRLITVILSAAKMLILWVSIAAIVVASPQPDTWSEFRGSGGRGIAEPGKYVTDWQGDQIQWKIALPGRGWSSPVLRGEQIWMTTAVENSNGGIELRALAVDRNQGQILHDIELFQVAQPPALHPQNSYASPTPAIVGNRVFCHFGTMGTAAIDVDTGRVAWRHNEFELDHETGPGSSPVAWNDKLILHCDGTDQQFIAALNLADGRVAWIQRRSGELHPEGMMKKAFATPIVVEIEGQPTIVSPGANWLYGYEPESGTELWRINYDRLGFSNVPRPLFIQGKIFVCTGFNKPAVQAITVTKNAQGWVARRDWEYDIQVPTIPSPLVVDQRLYMVGDRGIAACIDINTGKSLWQKRLAGDYAASPIHAGGNLFFCNRTGKVTIIKPGDSFEEIAAAELDGPIHATPAASEGQFFVRTSDSLYCIGSRIAAGESTQ